MRFSCRLALAIGALWVCVIVGCGGAIVEPIRASPDAAPSANATPSSDAALGDRSVDLDGAATLDSTVPPSMTSEDGPAEASNDATAVDANPHCECQNLEQCCNSAIQSDAGACRSEVAQGAEDMCRQDVLQDRYGCLSLGYAPRCPGVDDALCPHITTPCSQCVTATSNCVWVIQCLATPACKPALDAYFACDQQGRPFSECFSILTANGQVPGDLILRGAACGSACEADR